MQPSAGICCRAYHHITRQRACRRSSSVLHPCRTCHRQCPFRHRVFYQIRATADCRPRKAHFRPILNVTATLGRFCRGTNSKTAATYRDASCRQTRQIGDHEREEWRVRDARKPKGKESAAAIHRRSFRKSHPQRTGNKARQNCRTRLIEGLLPHHIYISLFEPSRIPVCLPAPRS